MVKQNIWDEKLTYFYFWKYGISHSLVKRTTQSKDTQVEVVKLSPSILVGLSKKILKKLNFFNKKGKKAKELEKPTTSQSYTQVSVPNVSKILKLKKNFTSLLTKKIENIYKAINNSGKVRPKINMTTKEPLRKQIIIPISNNNKAKFITFLSTYITNINIMNKVTSSSDLQTIEKYVKNIDHLDFEDMKILHLPQPKFYLKIIGIPYLIENTNTLINASIIESILKNNHIFNNVSLALKPQVIKMLPKSDIAII